MNRAPLSDQTCQVVRNYQVAPSLYMMEIDAPVIAEQLQPGQFIHMQLPGMDNHILRRPFSVYRVVDGHLYVLYQVVGYGTEHMTKLVPGLFVNCIGPIGRPWSMPEADSVLLVGGGVGAAPIFMLAQACAAAGKRVTVVLGAQTRDALVTLEDYQQIDGVEVQAATDDGSFGHAGFCTEPAQRAMQAGDCGFVACCGPEPLMRIVSSMAADEGIDCQVSMERRMACGVGACLSCVVDTTEGKQRACVDGPVFDANKVVW